MAKVGGQLRQEALHDVLSDGGCLQALDSRFQDPDGSWTWIRTETGFAALKELDRTIPIRSRHVVHPRWFEEDFIRKFEYFWGRSQAVPLSPIILTETEAGSFGIAYEEAFAVTQNSDDAHHGIHSLPCFGHLQPGKTVRRKGVILFAKSRGSLIAGWEQTGFETCQAAAPPR